MNIKHVGKLFLLFIVIVFSAQSAQAAIYVQGVYGTQVGYQCADPDIWLAFLFKSSSSSQITIDSSASCPLQSNHYVPKTGNYKIETIISDSQSHRVIVDVSSSSFKLDATKRISEQTIYTSTPTESFTGSTAGQALCQYLTDGRGHKYTADGVGTTCDDGSLTPLPPTPPAPDTSCTINSGNALNVNLNTVDRSQLPTTPGSGSMRHLQIPVECTGGVDVTVKMQLNYTPINLSTKQAVKSSANGLGVALVYNSKVILTTDTTPITFTTGSNSIDLAFQAVRDPTVEIKDIPTGAFTASAVLVMTQQ